MANIFDNIDSKNKYKLLHSFRADTYKYRAKDSIINIISETNSICLVIKGSLSLVRNNESGNNYVIEKINENNIIGSTFYNINDVDFDIVANEDTEIITMNYSDFINYRGKNKFYNILIKNIFSIINTKTRENNERINILTRKSIRNKLLEYFEIMYKKSNSRSIYLPFTFTELADYIAVDRSAMTRELKYLKEEGFINITGKRITLLYK